MSQNQITVDVGSFDQEIEILTPSTKLDSNQTHLIAEVPIRNKTAKPIASVKFKVNLKWSRPGMKSEASYPKAGVPLILLPKKPETARLRMLLDEQGIPAIKLTLVEVDFEESEEK